MGIGEYPAEYNPRIHGPYNPGRFYGKKDISFGEVKLGEVGSWLSRRSWNPQAMFAAMIRADWRWAQKYLLVKKTSAAPIAQFCVGMSILYYFLQYKAHISIIHKMVALSSSANHRHAKYH